MQRDFDAKLLVEIISTVCSNPDLNLGLVKSFVERKLLICILRVVDIVAEEWWLLQVELLERCPYTELRLGNLWLVVLEKVVIPIW